MTTQAILIIDPQCDFTTPDGALYVAGAEKDMERLSRFVSHERLNRIFVTMDSHRVMHIAHPAFWTNKAGENPAPFTVISSEDAGKGTWRAALNPDMCLDYLRRLEARGKKHTVWKPHCIMNTAGYDIHKELKQALTAYAAAGGEVSIIHKGDCIFAEHFSALKAEADSDLFPETKLNTDLIAALDGFDRIFLAGECADICVRETLRDLTEYAPQVVRKLVILSDCTSPLSAEFAFETDATYVRAVASGAVIAASNAVEAL
ncbi:MAG: isochorismatase family protein [Prevotella sp.]|nr:isochorismatase family protein [Prevotella sp.]